MVSYEVFNQVMTGLQNLYEKNLNEFVLNSYKAVFDKNFNDEQLQAAAIKIMETRVYPTFPKPGEFIEILKPDRINIEARALLAAAEVKNAVVKYGSYPSVCFEDFVIHKVIKYGIGGWVKLCRMDIKDFDNFIKFDFIKLYRSYSDNKTLIGEIPLYLTGSSESQNKHLEYKPLIKYIGYKDKCTRWQIAYSKKNKILVDQDQLKVLGLNSLMLEDKSPKQEFLETINKLAEKKNASKGVSRESFVDFIS